ncbi:MAG TPA: HD domain-containing protein [Planctomycetes bacterium]|nr:HD domain-containing protein [Planctomycetota bacterium]
MIKTGTMPGSPSSERKGGTAGSILILEKDPALRQAFSRHLTRWGEHPLLADSAEDALSLIRGEPEVFLAFLNLASISTPGLDLMEAIQDANPEVSVILTTDYVDPSTALPFIERGAFDYVKKPFLFEEIEILIRRVREHQELRSQATTLQILQETKKVERQNLIDFMIGLANLIDAKSPYTREHSDRVARTTKVFTRFLGLPRKDYEDISFGAKLHDIGKVGIPDSILNSTGKLSKEERQIMNDHPQAGARILKPILVMKDIIPMVLYHHENWDGTGYPERLREEEIPFGARIVKITDYYDAITSHRPYRSPLSLEEASQVLRSERGRILDPRLTDAFLDMLHQGGLENPNVSGVLPAVR